MNGLKIRVIVTLFSSLFMLPPTAMSQDSRIDIAILSETSNYEKLNNYLVDKGFKKLSRLNNTDPNDVGTTTGFARYKNKMLQSLDTNSHHLSDEVKRHKLFRDDWLIIWYE